MMMVEVTMMMVARIIGLAVEMTIGVMGNRGDGQYDNGAVQEGAV